MAEFLPRIIGRAAFANAGGLYAEISCAVLNASLMLSRVAAQGFFRRKTDGMRQTVPARSHMLPKSAGAWFDFVVAGDIAAELRVRNPLPPLSLRTRSSGFVHNVGKRQFRALFAAFFGDAVSDGTLGNHRR